MIMIIEIIITFVTIKMTMLVIKIMVGMLITTPKRNRSNHLGAVACLAACG